MLSLPLERVPDAPDEGHGGPHGPRGLRLPGQHHPSGGGHRQDEGLLLSPLTQSSDGLGHLFYTYSFQWTPFQVVLRMFENN